LWRQLTDLQLFAQVRENADKELLTAEYAEYAKMKEKGRQTA
jgi:hypothetical protein